MTRDGEIRAAVVTDTSAQTLVGHIENHVERGSTVYTDTYLSYKRLGKLDYDHKVIDHAEAYVQGRVHTNGLENFWTLLKRGLHGTYVSVQPYHLFRYLDERVLTYNLRESDDFGRFTHVLRTAIGRRLTWAELTGRS